MHLNWIAPVNGQSGFEKLSRALLEALDKIGIPISLTIDDLWNLSFIQLDSEVRNRLQTMYGRLKNGDGIAVMYQKNQDMPGKKKVIYTLFETDKCPYKESIEKVDQVWVFSNFNKEYWIKDGVPAEKIKVIHMPIFKREEYPPARITNKKRFTFLTIGDYTERKNFECLIRAYLNEFKDSDDVCLIMKVHYGGFIERYKNHVYNKIQDVISPFRHRNDLPKILYFPDLVRDEREMMSLYKTCDCFVLPTRGEGLCIPALEAVQAGLPVIITDWGGQTEYFNDVNAYIIKSRVVPITDLGYIQKCPQAMGHNWAEADEEHLRQLMREVYEGKGVEDKVSKYKYILEACDPTVVAKRIYANLKELR